MRRLKLMNRRAQRLVIIAALYALPTNAANAAEATASATDVARMQTDLVRLERELAEQKQLILNMMAADQQRYDVLLQLIRSTPGSQPGSAVLPNLPAMPAVPSVSKATSAEGHLGAPPAGAPAFGKLQGQATLPRQAGDAYVYIEGLHGHIGPLRTVEIRQEHKQFAPRVVAVPVGTKLIFPNRDVIYHNVFSKSRGNSFDLGSLKGGDTSSPVRLSQPGHVEILCNIHSQMRSDVLVVPNGYFAKVNADGSFELDGIPTGIRKLVLWAPGIKPESKVVEMVGALTRVQISATAAPTQPHLNKFGQAYGSYGE